MESVGTGKLMELLIALRAEARANKEFVRDYDPAKAIRLVKEAGLKETGMLTSSSDYHIFQKLKFPSRQACMDAYCEVVEAAFESGAIDVTLEGEPFITFLEAAGNAHVWGRSDSVAPNWVRPNSSRPAATAAL